MGQTGKMGCDLCGHCNPGPCHACPGNASSAIRSDVLPLTKFDELSIYSLLFSFVFSISMYISDYFLYLISYKCTKYKQVTIPIGFVDKYLAKT